MKTYNQLPTTPSSKSTLASKGYKMIKTRKYNEIKLKCNLTIRLIVFLKKNGHNKELKGLISHICQLFGKQINRKSADALITVCLNKNKTLPISLVTSCPSCSSLYDDGVPYRCTTISCAAHRQASRGCSAQTVFMFANPLVCASPLSDPCTRLPSWCTSLVYAT